MRLLHLILKQQMVNVQVFVVGMVKVIDSQITETFHTCESARCFHKKVLAFDGITRDVEIMMFDYVFPYMMQFIADLPVVAHNAAFDMNVLHQSIQNIGLPTPNLTYFCSYQLAKRTVDSYRYGLKRVT